MNYLRLFPEWNFYTRPDCDQEPPDAWPLSTFGENYKAGFRCLVLIAPEPINPKHDVPEDVDLELRVLFPLESTVAARGCGVPVGTRLLAWVPADSPVHGCEYQHHDNPDGWECVIAWRPFP